MNYCDLTLPSPAENVACDEALLEVAEEDSNGEVLRVWEPNEFFVVVGYANRVASEVNQDFCRRNNIPVFRRCTGGGTVLQGPGCLNYSLILQLPEQNKSEESGKRGETNKHALHSISSTNKFILGRHQAILTSVLQKPVEIMGHTDLAIGGLKFSGNAQRRKKRFLLFHGTFLLHFDISFMEKVLPLPSREPPYRQNRSHADFLTNLKISADVPKKTLRAAWKASLPLSSLPTAAIVSLISNKYSKAEWNYKF